MTFADAGVGPDNPIVSTLCLSVDAGDGCAPPPAPVIDLSDVDLAAFEAHARLSPREARAVALEAIERVVRPAAAALLGRDVLPRRRTSSAGWPARS